MRSASHTRWLTVMVAATVVGCGGSGDDDLFEGGGSPAPVAGGGGSSGGASDAGMPGSDAGNGNTAAAPLGATCVPAQESDPAFAGFSVSSVACDPDSTSCESGLCLANHFQGRVTCPYGQPGQRGNPTVPKPDGPGGSGERCQAPDSGELVEVVVEPQLVDRRPEAAVYCSCRCAGPDPSETYCQCPAGFECTELIPPTGNITAFPVGSYCVKQGTHIRSGTDLPSQRTCDIGVRDCGSPGGP